MCKISDVYVCVYYSTTLALLCKILVIDFFSFSSGCEQEYLHLKLLLASHPNNNKNEKTKMTHLMPF